MADSIAEAQGEKAAVDLMETLPSIATQLIQLSKTVDRATGFKNILINNIEGDKRDVMLQEVSVKASEIWNTVDSELKRVLDVIAPMLPNPLNHNQPHTRNTLLDSLRVKS